MPAPQPNSPPANQSPTRYSAAEDLLARNLPIRANKVVLLDETGSYTFAELAERVNRCANALLSLGIKPHARIALCLLDTIDFPTCFLGAIKAGIVPIPLNTMFQPLDYAHVLTDAQPQAIIISHSLLPQVKEAMGTADWHGQVIVSGNDSTELLALSALLANVSGTASAAPTSPGDVCFWLYSSGSTGKPKGAVHKQTSMARTAELFAQQVLGLREDDIIYSAAKLFFAYGLGNALSFPLAVGATAILYSSRATASAVYEVLRKHKPTIFCGVPTLFSALLACADLPSREQLALRLCVSAGEALPEQVGRAWTARTGVEIVDGIGSTEMLHIFISNRPGACRYGTTGKLVPGYKARLLDEKGREVPHGVMGELHVSGPTAAAYYWNDPERTKSTFVGEWVKTGDRFRVNDDGDYIYCGRSDEMLKVSGIWVSPTEVESALMAHDSVLEAAVVGVTDEHGLIKPKAFIVLKPGVAHRPGLDEELKVFLKGRLAPYKCPRAIEFRDELPKTATGKIRRTVLREEANAACKKPPLQQTLDAGGA